MLEFIGDNIGWIIALSIIFFVSGGFGLFDLWQKRKDRWVRIRHDAMPTVMERLKNARAFDDSDGIAQEELTIKVGLFEGKPVYRIRIPAHVFHNIEHEVILKELGIK
jgi:hypothetical protein